MSCALSAEDTYSKMITMDGDNVLLRIMDTSDKVNAKTMSRIRQCSLGCVNISKQQGGEIHAA